MQQSTIRIRAADGDADSYTYAPDGSGPFPGVLLYIDAIGIRPAMHEIARRIANAGYYVLMPDLFYRVPGWKDQDAKQLLTDPDRRAYLMEKIIKGTTSALAMRDTKAWLAYLDSQKNVVHDGFGLVGFCMGGRLAFVASGTYPDRVTAVAAYHPGGLATDAPDSPHTLAPKIEATLYIGGAKEDSSFDDAQKARLRKALDDANVDYSLETYDAKHGWVPTDMPVHDPAEAERAYRTILSLLETALR